MLKIFIVLLVVALGVKAVDVLTESPVLLGANLVAAPEDTKSSKRSLMEKDKKVNDYSVDETFVQTEVVEGTNKVRTMMFLLKDGHKLEVKDTFPKEYDPKDTDSEQTPLIQVYSVIQKVGTAPTLEQKFEKDELIKMFNRCDKVMVVDADEKTLAALMLSIPLVNEVKISIQKNGKTDLKVTSRIDFGGETHDAITSRQGGRFQQWNFKISDFEKLPVEKEEFVKTVDAWIRSMLKLKDKNYVYNLNFGNTVTKFVEKLDEENKKPEASMRNKVTFDYNFSFPKAEKLVDIFDQVLAARRLSDEIKLPANIIAV